MNLYSQKQRWKIALAFFAVLIISFSIWYSSNIASKISFEEREKVRLWAQAIQKKADLVNITNASFEQLKKKEREKIELYAQAIVELSKDNLSDYTFPLSIVQKNNSIPVISIDEFGQFLDSNNLNFDQSYFTSNNDSIKSLMFNDSIQKLIENWSEVNKPIQIKYLENKWHQIFHGNSPLFAELKAKRDYLIEMFNRDLVNNEALVPVIFIDSASHNVIASNLDSIILNDSILLESEINAMKEENSVIRINLASNQTAEIYFHESKTLKLLRFYPYVQLGIIGLFLIISYLLFSTFRKAEQNQVWAGMAKETAHQLGTPLSSLMAWIEILRSDGVDEEMLSEMNKDILRLNTVTDRFSKIGSKVELKPESAGEIIQKTVDYFQKRVSSKVSFYVENYTSNEALINTPLFEWVIENLTKNAIDAMENKGKIIFNLSSGDGKIFIDITDTGKGIPPSKLKTIFEPGYTTKSRGWGLGLSLVKRIIEDYHKGKIFVKKSTINEGTTFRIELNKAQ